MSITVTVPTQDGDFLISLDGIVGIGPVVGILASTNPARIQPERVYTNRFEIKLVHNHAIEAVFMTCEHARHARENLVRGWTRHLQTKAQ